MRKCFWCYFRQLFISLAFRKCKKDCNILKVILLQGTGKVILVQSICDPPVGRDALLAQETT